MKLYYDPTRNTCVSYNDLLGEPPEGCAEISKAEHTALQQGQTEGREIYAKEDGSPGLRDRTVSIEAQEISDRETKIELKIRIDAGESLNIDMSEEQERLSAL